MLAAAARSPASQTRELVASNSRHWLAPLAPDSELCGRCIPFSFRCAAHTPFRCPQTSETGDARPCGSHPRRREHGQFRYGYVRERDCAYAEPGQPHCRPPSLSAHRVESPGRSAWLRALSPALPAEATRRLEPDGRAARPPRPVEGADRLRACSSGYDAPACASGPALQARRLSPRWF